MLAHNSIRVRVLVEHDVCERSRCKTLHLMSVWSNNEEAWRDMARDEAYTTREERRCPPHPRQLTMYGLQRRPPSIPSRHRSSRGTAEPTLHTKAAVIDCGNLLWTSTSSPPLSLPRDFNLVTVPFTNMQSQLPRQHGIDLVVICGVARGVALFLSGTAPEERKRADAVNCMRWAGGRP